MFLVFLAPSELVSVETGYSKLLLWVANEFYQCDALAIEFNEKGGQETAKYYKELREKEGIRR